MKATKLGKALAMVAATALSAAVVAGCSSQAPVWGCSKVMTKHACKGKNTCKGN